MPAGRNCGAEDSPMQPSRRGRYGAAIMLAGHVLCGQVRSGLSPGGRWIRTIGPPQEPARTSESPVDAALPRSVEVLVGRAVLYEPTPIKGIRVWPSQIRRW